MSIRFFRTVIAVGQRDFGIFVYCSLQKFPVNKAVPAVFVEYKAFQCIRSGFYGNELDYFISRIYGYIKISVKTDDGSKRCV